MCNRLFQLYLDVSPNAELVFIEVVITKYLDSYGSAFKKMKNEHF